MEKALTKVRQTYEQRAEQFAMVCNIGILVLTDADISTDEKE